MTYTSPRPSRLVDHLRLQAKKLRLDAEAARLFVGTTDIGHVTENAVRHFLASVLPGRYSVGVGEAIAATGEQPRRMDQTQQKDVLIYDPLGGAVLGWDASGISLFPVESIYGVIEVKTSIHSQDSLLKAVDQALEVRDLCRAGRNPSLNPPFTGVFAFESKGVTGNALFEALEKRSPNQRPDFALVLDPGDSSAPDTSYYYAHWRYHSRGSGNVDFVSAEAAAQERALGPSDPDKRLTFCASDVALLWFYLFLVEQLDAIHLKGLSHWIGRYIDTVRDRLGYKRNE